MRLSPANINGSTVHKNGGNLEPAKAMARFESAPWVDVFEATYRLSFF